MTWRDVKNVIESQGVTDLMQIQSIAIIAGRPVIVEMNPNDPRGVKITSSYE